MSDEKDMTQKKTWRDRFRRGEGSGRAASGRRRFLLRAAIVAIVVIAFIIIPGYIASQPSFMRRYPRFAPEYQTWSTSVHAEVPCQRCHVAPGFLAQTGYSLRMLGEFYLSAVSPSTQPKLFPPPTNAACQSCHVDLRTVSPSGDLNIPHPAHVILLKMRCITCHAYLVHTTNPTGTHTPAMATCLTCHNGRTAKNGCSTCHTNKGEPVNHRSPNWVIIHPQMQTKMDCKGCHAWTPNWCATCHAQRPKSHTANWRAIHGQAVKVHRNCEACHEAAFCIRCHGDVPQLNFNPALKLVK